MEQRNNRPDSEMLAALTGAAYAALFLLGVVVGVLGCFHFTAAVFDVPVGVVIALVANFVMCWLGGLGMRSKLGAALPAGGWLIAVMVFAVQRPEGDIVVTNSGIGLAFLFGGTVAAGVGIGMAPSAWMGRGDRGVQESGADRAFSRETSTAGDDPPAGPDGPSRNDG